MDFLFSLHGLDPVQLSPGRVAPALILSTTPDAEACAGEARVSLFRTPHPAFSTVQPWTPLLTALHVPPKEMAMVHLDYSAAKRAESDQPAVCDSLLSPTAWLTGPPERG
jgi:hypothetical protein